MKGKEHDQSATPAGDEAAVRYHLPSAFAAQTGLAKGTTRYPLAWKGVTPYVLHTQDWRFALATSSTYAST
eukprot:5053124-Amphidinium_carterae.1